MLYQPTLCKHNYLFSLHRLLTNHFKIRRSLPVCRLPWQPDPRIHHDHPQSIGINHPLTFNNSINNSNQSFSALLHEVHDTLELGAGYQNIDRPAPSTYHQPFTCSTPKQSPTTFMNSLEVQELQKEVSLLKSAVEVLHDEVRALKKKLKVIV